MAVDGVIRVNGLVDDLERQQTRRLTHLESLQYRFHQCQRDSAELQELCREVDETENKKINFSRLARGLEDAREALDKTATREAELFTPQQYEATFERRLFHNTLGLDIRLTQDRLISLVFSHIDSKQPDRQFRVTLDVSDTGHWEVVSLNPHVHGVDELLQRLNSEGGIITQFCKSFRVKCKDYIMH